jgi:hypothetical protein
MDFDFNFINHFHCGICGRQSGMFAGFISSTLVSPASSYSTKYSISFMTSRAGTMSYLQHKCQRARPHSNKKIKTCCALVKKNKSVYCVSQTVRILKSVPHFNFEQINDRLSVLTAHFSYLSVKVF